MAYTGNNSWKREAGPWEPKGKMIGNMERKKRHSRGHGDRKLDMKSVSCLTLMKTSPRCGFAAGDHLHLLALYLTWSDLLILLESVCRPAFLLLLTSTFSSFWPVGSVQSVLWFHWNKSSKCIAQSSQNFGCTVQFTLLFLPWSMHPSWGCGVHPIVLPWTTEGERHGLACQTLHTFLPLTLESLFGFTMAWVLWLLNHSLEFSKRYSFLYIVSSVFLLRTEGL